MNFLSHATPYQAPSATAVEYALGGIPDFSLTNVSCSQSAPNPPKDELSEEECASPATTRSLLPSLPRSSPPDGDKTAWLQVLGCFFCWFNSWGLTNAFGIFQSYYEQEPLRNNTPSQISWIGSIQSFLLFAVGVLAGPAYDAGYFTWLVWAGSFLVVFGYLMTSLSSSYGVIMFTQGILVGVGSGCLFIPSVSILPQYFNENRALANGIAASGSSFGGVIYPIAFHQLLPLIGFGWSVRVLALIALSTCAVALATLKVRSPPPKRRLLFDLAAFKELPFLTFTVCLFLALIGLYIPTFYIQSFAIQKHITNDQLAAFVLPILNAAGVVGRIAPNLLADRTGPLNILAPCLAMAGILALAWISVENIGGLVVLALAYGFFSGAILSLPTVVVVSLSPSLGVIGTRMGTSFAVASLGLLIGTPVSGAILGSTGNFVGLQVFAGIVLMASAVFCVWSRVAKAGVRMSVRA